MTSSAGLSRAGQVFFGGLCVGTFGLGTWQTKRYWDKIQLIQERQDDLQQEPVTEFKLKDILHQQQSSKKNSCQQLQLHGRFDHQHEFLVGPRGPPPGAFADGGGMSSSPQGFYVITPLKLAITGETVLVNRGWVPRAMVVPDRRRSHNNTATTNDLLQWERPDTTQLVAVPSRAETPTFSWLVPQHDFESQPPRLYWYDPAAMLQAAGVSHKQPSLMVTAVQQQQKQKLQLPLRPSVEHVGDFKVTPATHVGYAATWYGLSLAGVYMTRMLLRR